MAELVKMFEEILAERRRRREAGLPADGPPRRVRVVMDAGKEGIDASIPAGERNERPMREPGEEG